MTLMERSLEADVEVMAMVCVAVRDETSEARTFVFKRCDGGEVSFSAGQFLNFTFDVNGGEECRSYSISSSSARRGAVAITVKRVAGGVASNWAFDSLRVGGRVIASGPAGGFVCDPHLLGKMLLLSAGSGITPLASMMRSMADHCMDVDAVFLHFARSPEEMIFRDELTRWARLLPNARIMVVATNPRPGSGWVGPTGRIGRPMLDALVPDLASRIVMTCGPDGFMSAAKDHCLSLGVPERNFHQENFDQVAVDESPVEMAASSFEINFQKSGKSTRGSTDSTILKAAQAAKVRIQTSCGKGICGTCRIKIVSGTVEMNHGGGIRQREIDQGYALACCSRPTSNLVIDR